MDEMKLPKFDYHLDESDPDLVMLRRQDGSLVAAFSARVATREGIVEAAKDDYRALIQEHAESLRRQQEGNKIRVERPTLHSPPSERTPLL